ncbi:hypothetical protein GCM10029978_063660 [Actinoallomurus acanthiterrae]
MNAVLDEEHAVHWQDTVSRTGWYGLVGGGVGAGGDDTTSGQPLRTTLGDPWDATVMTKVGRWVVPSPRPAGTDQDDVPTPGYDQGLVGRIGEIVVRDLVAAGKDIDARGHGDVEEHTPADERFHLINAELIETAAALGLRRVHTAVQPAVVGDVRESVHMRTDVPAHDEELIRCGAAIRASHVAVPAEQGHAEAWMVGRYRNIRGERLGQIDDPDS